MSRLAPPDDPNDPLAGLPRAGDLFADKYRVERVIGAGGMGVVFAAVHAQLGERVALKLLRPDQIEDADTVARFVREAQAAARIRGDHVARVVDVGTAPSGLPYIVFEFLEGRDLGAHIKINGRMGVVQSVDWLLEACEALAEAHAMGIVHRDVKPSNLFLSIRPDGSLSVKVLDFGISKLGAANIPSMTRTAAVFGSPSYMSPEQVKSSKLVDARSDIWSLGVVLYELLTGDVPFPGEAAVEITAAVLREDPLPLRKSAPYVPAALEAVCLKCLKKKPDDRYSSVAELAAALGPFASPSARDTVARITRILERMRTSLASSPLGTPSTPYFASPGLNAPSSPGTGTIPLLGASLHQGSVARRPGNAGGNVGGETVVDSGPPRAAILVAAVAFGVVVAVGGAVVARLVLSDPAHDRVSVKASDASVAPPPAPKK